MIVLHIRFAGVNIIKNVFLVRKILVPDFNTDDIRGTDFNVSFIFGILFHAQFVFADARKFQFRKLFYMPVLKIHFTGVIVGSK